MTIWTLLRLALRFVGSDGLVGHWGSMRHLKDSQAPTDIASTRPENATWLWHPVLRLTTSALLVLLWLFSSQKFQCSDPWDDSSIRGKVLGMQAWQPGFSPGILLKVKGGRCHLTSTHMPEQVNDIHNVLSRVPEQVNDIYTALFHCKNKLA